MRTREKQVKVRTREIQVKVEVKVKSRKLKQNNVIIKTLRAKGARIETLLELFCLLILTLTCIIFYLS